MGTTYAGEASSIGAVPPLHGNHIAPLHLAPAPDHRRVRDRYMYNIDPQIQPSDLKGSFCNSPVTSSDTRCHLRTFWDHPATFMYGMPQSKFIPVPYLPLVFDIALPANSEILRLLFRKEKINNYIKLLCNPTSPAVHSEEIRIATHTQTITIRPCTKD